jgi:hypothetical protein
LIAFDSDCWMTSEGTKVSPPPNEKDTASPAATKPISTPVAPASAPMSTFRLTEQVPRSIYAILPAGLASRASPGQPRPM